MKDREQILAAGKMDRNIGRFIFASMAALAVTSSGAVASSVPLEIFDVLPQWANAVIAAGGLAVAPGSILSVKEGRKWLAHADQVIRDYEAQMKQKTPIALQ